MSYSQNTSGTTGDGILAILKDLVSLTDSRPYAHNTAGTTLDGVFWALYDLKWGTSNAPYPQNTSGTTLDGVLQALKDKINSTDNRPYVSNILGQTLASILIAITDAVFVLDRRPYALNTAATTLNGWVEALTDLVAAGGFGATIQLSSATVADTAAIGSVIGTLSVAGGTGTYVFTLISNPGSLFSITGSSLKVAAALTAGSYSITVHADNGAGSVLNRVFLITVTSSAVIRSSLYVSQGIY